MTSKEAANKLQMPHVRFKWYAGRMALGRPVSTKYRAPRDYSEDDLNKLRSLTYNLIDIDEAARILELSKTQVRLYATKLGIKKRPPFSHFWFTAEEIEQIRVAHEEGHARQQRGNRRRQHEALFRDRDNRDYFGKVRAFRIEKTENYHGQIEGGPGVPTLQWHAFYPAEELDPEDSDTAKWGNVNETRKWISFEDLQQWHPEFMKDRY